MWRGSSDQQITFREIFHVSYLVVGLLQPGHGVPPHRGVGELGREQLQGVLHVHGPPLPQQLQSLLGLLRQVPVHTLEELRQGLGRKGGGRGAGYTLLYIIYIFKGWDADLLLRGEVVSELPHQVLLFRGQLLGRRVAHDDLSVDVDREWVIMHSKGETLCRKCTEKGVKSVK